MNRIKEIIKTHYEHDYDTTINDYIKAYKKCKALKKYKIDDMIYLTETGEGIDTNIFFTFPKTNNVYICNFMDVTFEDVSFRYKLEIGKKCFLDSLEFLPNSSNEFYYILYTFEQSKELPISCLMIDENRRFNDSNCKEIYSCYDSSSHIIKWTDELTVVLDENCPCKILKNNEFVSGFNDIEDNFQIGDSQTRAFIDNSNNLLIYHYGDVSSAIIISKTA